MAESRPRRIFPRLCRHRGRRARRSREALDGIQRAVDFHDSRLSPGNTCAGTPRNRQRDQGDAHRKSRAGHGYQGDPRIEKPSRGGRHRVQHVSGASGNRVARGSHGGPAMASILQHVVPRHRYARQISGGLPARFGRGSRRDTRRRHGLDQGAARLHRDQPLHARGGRSRFDRSLHGREAGEARAAKNSPSSDGKSIRRRSRK